MFCPKCGYKVYPEETTCKICLTPLTKGPSAKKPRQWEGTDEIKEIGRRLTSFLRQKSPIFLVIAGLAVIAYGISYYTSPLLRLKLNGIRLQYNPSAAAPILYLVGAHSETKSWAFRGDTMDTPLNSNELNETGTVSITANPGPLTGHTVHLKTEEWVKMVHAGDQTVNQTIPPNHPSIAPGSVVLDSQGSVLEKQNAASLRLGRAMNFIFPLFPKGTQHQESSWMEHLSWEEAIGEWQVAWDADLVWQLKDFEMCDQVTCAKLVYRGTLHPRVVRAPSWANQADKDVAFDGQANGEALYNTREKILIGNSLQYSGKLSMQISDLARVPEDQRVGASEPQGPGTIVIQFSNKFDIQKPN